MLAAQREVVDELVAHAGLTHLVAPVDTQPRPNSDCGRPGGSTSGLGGVSGFKPCFVDFIRENGKVVVLASIALIVVDDNVASLQGSFIVGGDVDDIYLGLFVFVDVDVVLVQICQQCGKRWFGNGAGLGLDRRLFV